MRLTEKQIVSLEPRAKTYRLFDEHGLYVEVSPKGTKTWRLAVTLNGRDKRITIGRYPLLKLRDARMQAEAIRRQIATGQYASRDNLLQDIALDFLARKKQSISQNTLQALTLTIKRITDKLGAMPIRAIKPRDVLTAAESFETINKNAPRLFVSTCSRIFRFGVACGVCDSDPCRDLIGVLPTPPSGHRTALVTVQDAQQLIATIKSSPILHVMSRAVLLWMAYTLARVSETVGAEWSEIDVDKRLWVIPAHRMKVRQAHVVPLPSQCLDLLEPLLDARMSERFLFPSLKNDATHVARSTVLLWLRAIGCQPDQMCVHGFRSMGSTILNERGYDPDIIEKALAHSGRGVRAIYNRASYLDERRTMLQDYADLLDGLKS